jgi:hypothetical protein
MIRILRGPAPVDTLVVARAAERSSRPFFVDRAPAFEVPWQGARSLLAETRSRVGDAAFERATGPHRALLSLLFRRLEGVLSPEERNYREKHRGLLHGSMPYPMRLPAPIAQAVAAVFDEALAGERAAIAVRNLAFVDPETMGLLRWLVVRMRDRVDIWIGHDTGYGGEGEAWQAALHINKISLSLLEAIDGTTVEMPAPPDSAGSATPMPREAAVDPLDDGLERRAWQALARAPFSPSDYALVVAAVRAAFDATGSCSALALAEGLLKASPEPSDVSEIHFIAASCAFEGGAGHETERGREISVGHAREAFRGEGDRARRSSLAYRLCLDAAHRRDVAGAIELANVAIDESRRLPRSRAAFWEAWARSGGALPRFRSGRPDEAVAECETAIALLDASKGELEVHPVDLTIARYHIVNNLARMADARGDRTKAREWQSSMDACEDAIPHGWTQNPGWTSPNLVDRDLAAAVGRWEARRADAVRHCDPRLEAVAANHLVDFYLRLGEGRLAFERAASALRAWRILVNYQEQVLVAEINCAMIGLRAGLLDDAERGLEAIGADSRADGDEIRCELLAAMTLVAAKRGDLRRLDERETTLRVSLEGIADASTRVRCLTGLADALLIVGRVADARSALEEALAVATVAGEKEVTADEVLLVLGGLIAAGRSDPDVVNRAARVALRALDDVNGWAALPRVLPAVADFADADGSLAAALRDDDLRRGMERLAEAGLQRTDCAAPARRLQCRLEVTLPSNPGPVET